jgi:hypothetical protein
MHMRWTGWGVGVLALVISLSSCGGHSIDYTSTEVNAPARAAKDPAQVVVFVDGPPDKPYSTTGFLAAGGAFSTGGIKDALRVLKAKAAELGLDGIYEVVCGAPGTVGQGTCNAKGFVFK